MPCVANLGTIEFHRVPFDIRASVNNAEDTIGFPRTDFGEDVGATHED